MTDDIKKPTGADMGSTSDDSFAWTEPESTSTDAGAKAREWIAQLQTMIENLATQAAPVVKEIGAKAAELAAVAGDKAGPVAQKAAEYTGKAGEKIATKSRDFAAELRRDATTDKISSGTAADIAESTMDDKTPSGVA